MSKVIVERPRRPGYDGETRHRGRKIDTDLMPSKEGMRAPHRRHYGYKELNENLAPLRRFLQRRTGRPWNEVYGEISQNLRATNTVQQHVRDHLWDFVDRHTKLRNGEIWGVGWLGPCPINESWKPFYVDPRNGILRENNVHQEYLARRRQKQREDDAMVAARLHVTEDGIEYRKVNGIWYEVIWDLVPPPRAVAMIDDKTEEERTVLRTSNRVDVFTNEIHNKEGARYRSGKKQASNEVLRRLGLSNDPPDA